MGGILQAIVVGVVIVLVGSMARNLLWTANLHVFTAVPWAILAIATFLYFFWRYLNGAGPPPETSQYRRSSLRANRLRLNVWVASLIAGGLGLVALVLALRVANRMVVLPEQPLPDLSAIPQVTVLSLLIAGAPVAGIIEEAAFRGYMQVPIEKRYGLVVAILITGTMFALVHLDFTPVLWPYYVAVAAIYGTVTKDTGYSARGLDLIRTAAATGRPVVAIGGITLARAFEVLDAGAQSVAVISDLVTDGEPERKVRLFLDRLAR